MQFLDELEGNPLFDDYKLIIQTGTAELLELPERKEVFSNDWREENGQEYDLSLAKYKDKEVTLSCCFLCNDDADYWNCYNSFWQAIRGGGWLTLYIHDHSKTYNVFYKKTSGWKKGSKRLKDVSKVLVKFQLTLQVQY